MELCGILFPQLDRHCRFDLTVMYTCKEHHVEDMVVNTCEPSYLYNIFSSGNKKKK